MTDGSALGTVFPEHPLPFWVFLTPALAQEWKSKFRRNRSLRTATYEAYGRDMLSGRWRPRASSPLMQGTDGLFDNGQHRVHAVIWAGEEDSEFAGILVQVQPGITEEDRPVVDTGIPRSYADLLRMRGVEYYNITSSVTKRMLLWDHGRYMVFGGPKFSHQETDSYLEAHSEEIAAACRFSREASDCFLSSAVLATINIILSRIDSAAADEFLKKLITGAGLEPGDPILALRNKLTREAVARHGRGVTFADGEYRRALCFHAWNHWRKGHQLFKVQDPKNKWTNSNYPVPK